VLPTLTCNLSLLLAGIIMRLMFPPDFGKCSVKSLWFLTRSVLFIRSQTRNAPCVSRGGLTWLWWSFMVVQRFYNLRAYYGGVRSFLKMLWPVWWTCTYFIALRKLTNSCCIGSLFYVRGRLYLSFHVLSRCDKLCITCYFMCLSFVAHYYFMHETRCSLFHLVPTYYWAPYFIP
jgi:hypothetical protein